MTQSQADAVEVGARNRLRTRRRAFLLVMFAVVLEVVLLMPFVDHLADANQTIHFTQHGFIFGGGVLLGMALRDVQRASRR
jgi:RsiW-degrading membrane proteinase PrsW (M82 family)